MSSRLLGVIPAEAGIHYPVILVPAYAGINFSGDPEKINTRFPLSRE